MGFSRPTRRLPTVAASAAFVVGVAAVEASLLVAAGVPPDDRTSFVCRYAVEQLAVSPIWVGDAAPRNPQKLIFFSTSFRGSWFLEMREGKRRLLAQIRHRLRGRDRDQRVQCAGARARAGDSACVARMRSRRVGSCDGARARPGRRDAAHSHEARCGAVGGRAVRSSDSIDLGFRWFLSMVVDWCLRRTIESVLGSLRRPVLECV